MESWLTHGPDALGAHSSQPLGAHRGRGGPGGNPGLLLLALFPVAEHRGPSCHCTQGQFHTLSTTVVLRWDPSVLGLLRNQNKLMGKTEDSSERGRDRLGLTPRDVPRHQSFGHRYLSPSLSARPEGTQLPMIESLLYDFCALFYNLCKPPRNLNQSAEWKSCRHAMTTQATMVKIS